MSSSPLKPSDHELPTAKTILESEQMAPERSFAYIIVTALAAALNMVVLLFLCFIAMPRLEGLITEATRIREEIVESRREAKAARELAETNWKELDQHRAVIRRLHDILEAQAAAIKKKAEEDAKKKKDAEEAGKKDKGKD